MDDEGAIYVAFGDKARAEAARSLAGLHNIHPDLPVSVVSNVPLPTRTPANFIQADTQGPGARRIKLTVDRLSPYDFTLYLDADTRVLSDISMGFSVLRNGWDLALAPSHRQGRDVLGHLSTNDRHWTLTTIENEEPLNLQAGVMFFRKSETIHRFFSVWRHEWERFLDQDQGALLRAIRQVPVRIWLLGKDWNGQDGRIVKHMFGQAR